jgi:hypothetical protein
MSKIVCRAHAQRCEWCSVSHQSCQVNRTFNSPFQRPAHSGGPFGVAAYQPPARMEAVSMTAVTSFHAFAQKSYDGRPIIRGGSQYYLRPLAEMRCKNPDRLSEAGR